MNGDRPPATEGPRILVSGWAGAGNVGDELLTRSVVDRLRALGAVPVVASGDPAQTTALHGVEAVRWGPRGRRAVRHVDGVCLGPGGILQDSSSLWSLPGHLVAPIEARRRSIPVAAIGVGAESIRRRSSSWLLRRALGGVRVITRDSESTAALGETGLSPETGADVVFGLALPEPSPANEIVVSVGGTVRPGLISPARRRIEAPPIDAIVAALDRLAAALDARVVLTRFRGERDAVVAARIAERLASGADILSADVDQHVRRVTGARLVVSSRYHPLVLAARAGVPAIAVSSQAKVRSLVAQLGSEWVAMPLNWSDVTPAVVPKASAPTVPAGIELAHEALAELVVEAGASRRERSSG